ncbi:MAG: class I SAM-dependent methyltransferase [Candidatus Sumerlaeia bacterium]|nr:class I SAM-dependent methyltransferase [Candidatus Sumerlaeia bacterium]
MNLSEYDKMYQLEDSYWWFQGRKRMIQSILERFLPEEPRPGRVLDVGCGTGMILQSYQKWSPVGADFSPLALQYCQSRGLKRTVRADVTRLPFADNSLDLILALDLIEHVERHDLLIKEFQRVLRPGGCVMATVPAHPSLWSEHDVALHHYRRYTRKSFAKLLRHGNLKPIKYTYGLFFLHPAVVTFRMLQNLKNKLIPKTNGEPKAHLISVPKWLNSLLIQIFSFEARLLRHMNFPTGTSLVVLAQKPKTKSK